MENYQKILQTPKSVLSEEHSSQSVFMESEKLINYLNDKYNFLQNK